MRIHRPNGLPGAPAGRKDHTTDILAKLQVNNRSEAAAIARGHGKPPLMVTLPQPMTVQDAARLVSFKSRLRGA
jgi:hypothetical protein